MKIAVICPETFTNKFKQIIPEFPSIQFDFLIYKEYLECDELIKQQKNYDGILFSGLISYYIARDNLDESAVYEILPRYEGEVVAALLQVSQMGYSIERVSFDTYSRKLVQEALLEVGIHKIEEEIVGMKEAYDDYQSNQMIYHFHKKAVESGMADVCVTTHNGVAKLLQADGIPCIKSERTLDTIRMTVRRLQSRYMEQQSMPKDIAAICLKLSVYERDDTIESLEYQQIMDKIKVMEQVYIFARELEAAVVEGNNGHIYLFTRKKTLIEVTKNYTHFFLLEHLRNKIFNRFSVGIGYGSAISEAKKNAIKAMKQSRKYEQSVIFLAYDSTKMVGPIGVHGNSAMENLLVEEKLAEISQNSGVSMKYLLRMKEVMEQMRKNTFTSKEMAEYCNVSVRNMDRTIEKLMSSGYAGIAGMKSSYDTGRPSRVLIFYI